MSSNQMSQRQPNFLFLFPDQWRWDWLGCEQAIGVRTPNLDALAARGVRFTQCRVNSPLCGPSRACLATGRRYERAGVRDNKQDTNLAHGTVFQILRNAGYRVATCGKNDLHKGSNHFTESGWHDCLAEYGFTEAVDQGGKWCVRNRIRDHLPEAYGAYLQQQDMDQVYFNDMQRRQDMRQSEQGHVIDTSPHDLPREHYTDDFCGRAALSLLDGLPVNDPWMLWVNFPGPHEPFDPPAELRKRYDGVTFPQPITGDQLPNGHLEYEYKIRYEDKNNVSTGHDPNDHQQIRRNYAAMIEGIDEWVGKIIEHVAQRGELDNTVIVFASDHGEMLGDHGLWYKCCAYEASIHVPLICAGPGISPHGTRHDAMIELIDLAATFIELAGESVPEDWDARSFANQLDDSTSTPHRDLQFSSLKHWKCVFDGRWKLIQTQDAQPVLFDLETDPDELNNRYGDPTCQTVFDRLNDALTSQSQVCV